MKKTWSSTVERAPRVTERAPLDLVVPFTTPHLTEVALQAANRLGAGLDSAVRAVRVQVVPFPLDLRFSPVPVEFLESQLIHLSRDVSSLPFTAEIRLAREFDPGLLGALRFRSMVVLATKKRPWRTRTERLAATLRAAGYTVVMVNEDNGDAPFRRVLQERKNA